jgi:hypothetical protein
MAGGGARGTGGGIAHGTTAEAGLTIMPSLLFMEESIQGGGMTIGRTVGRARNGVTKEYPTGSFNRFIKGIIMNNLGGNLKLGPGRPDRNAFKLINHNPKEEHCSET